MPRGVRAPKAKPQAPPPAPVPTPPQISGPLAPVTPEMPLPAPSPVGSQAPRYFMVAEHITPSTKRHPGATMQYAAGRFYAADDFLLALWRHGDPCIQPYEPAEKV